MTNDAFVAIRAGYANLPGGYSGGLVGDRAGLTGGFSVELEVRLREIEYRYISGQKRTMDANEDKRSSLRMAWLMVKSFLKRERLHHACSSTSEGI